MNIYLIVSAALSAIASLLHVGCIIYGATWYRFFGAGEQMAVLAEQGNMMPTIITSIIAFMLLLWSIYALSAAGVIQQLPFLRAALIVITFIYLMRGIAGFFLIGYIGGNSPEFWLWSSVVCLIYGLFHLAGLIQAWSYI